MTYHLLSFCSFAVPVFFHLSDREVEITSDQSFVSVYLSQNNPFFRVHIKIELTVFPGAPLFPFLPGWALFPFTKPFYPLQISFVPF